MTDEEILVALFHGDQRISDWVRFSAGKIHVSDAWLKEHSKNGRAILTKLQIRTNKGHTVARARTHVQELIVKTYAVTWRTQW